MDYQTHTEWNEETWGQAERIYQQAFREDGRKDRAIIRRMFTKHMCQLHMAAEREEVVAMALTGMNKEANVLILDYIAVEENSRSKGYGKSFMAYIIDWARNVACSRGIIVEVEAEASPENRRRIQFWESCSFRLTAYVHQYIWVPEPYRAMSLSFNRGSRLPEDGEMLFQYITQFHKKAYARS